MGVLNIASQRQLPHHARLIEGSEPQRDSCLSQASGLILHLKPSSAGEAHRAAQLANSAAERVHEIAHAPRWEGDMTLKQACSHWFYPLQAPGAFKDLMTHVLQFALRIAFRCVLHRRKSQDIRC